MLRLAMKAIPLRHDDVPLNVLFEDEHLLAVNKPPGVLTAPKHRYAVRAAVASPLHQVPGYGIRGAVSPHRRFAVPIYAALF